MGSTDYHCVVFSLSLLVVFSQSLIYLLDVSGDVIIICFCHINVSDNFSFYIPLFFIELCFHIQWKQETDGTFDGRTLKISWPGESSAHGQTGCHAPTYFTFHACIHPPGGICSLASRYLCIYAYAVITVISRPAYCWALCFCDAFPRQPGPCIPNSQLVSNGVSLCCQCRVTWQRATGIKGPSLRTWKFVCDLKWL